MVTEKPGEDARYKEERRRNTRTHTSKPSPSRSCLNLLLPHQEGTNSGESGPNLDCIWRRTD